jgi:hypothetical protein
MYYHSQKDHLTKFAENIALQCSLVLPAYIFVTIFHIYIFFVTINHYFCNHLNVSVVIIRLHCGALSPRQCGEKTGSYFTHV